MLVALPPLPRETPSGVGAAAEAGATNPAGAQASGFAPLLAALAGSPAPPQPTSPAAPESGAASEAEATGMAPEQAGGLTAGQAAALPTPRLAPPGPAGVRAGGPPAPRPGPRPDRGPLPDAAFANSALPRDAVPDGAPRNAALPAPDAVPPPRPGSVPGEAPGRSPGSVPGFGAEAIASTAEPLHRRGAPVPPRAGHADGRAPAPQPEAPRAGDRTAERAPGPKAPDRPAPVAPPPEAPGAPAAPPSAPRAHGSGAAADPVELPAGPPEAGAGPEAPPPVRPGPGPSERREAAAPAPQPALPARVTWLAAEGGGTARLQLHPRELGEVEVAVRVRGSRVDVQFIADDPSAQLAVAAAREQLVEALGARELRMEGFEVRSGTDPGAEREAGRQTGDTGARDEAGSGGQRRPGRGRDEGERTPVPPFAAPHEPARAASGRVNLRV